MRPRRVFVNVDVEWRSSHVDGIGTKHRKADRGSPIADRAVFGDQDARVDARGVVRPSLGRFLWIEQQRATTDARDSDHRGQ